MLNKFAQKSKSHPALPKLLDAGYDTESGSRVVLLRNQGISVLEIQNVDVGQLVVQIGSGLSQLHASLLQFKESAL